MASSRKVRKHHKTRKVQKSRRVASNRRVKKMKGGTAGLFTNFMNHNNSINLNSCPGCNSDNTVKIGNYILSTPHPDNPKQIGGSCGTCGNCGCTQPPLLFQRGGKKNKRTKKGGSSCGSPLLMQKGGSSCGSPSLTGSLVSMQKGGATACPGPADTGILKGPNGLTGQQGGSMCGRSLTGSSNINLYGGAKKTRKTQKGGGFFDWAKPFWNPNEPGAGGYNTGYKVLAPSKWGVGPSGPIGAPRSTAGDDPIPKHQPWSAEFRNDPHLYQKGGKKNRKSKKGGSIFTDIGNLGRQAIYGAGSTLNTLNGYEKPTDPSPLYQFPRGLGSPENVPQASMLNVPMVYRQGQIMAGNS